jgi:hypothetical protein
MWSTGHSNIIVFIPLQVCSNTDKSCCDSRQLNKSDEMLLSTRSKKSAIDLLF